MDPISAMLGLQKDDESLKALADGLRGRQKAADFFALTTVPQIARGAQNEQALVADAATRAGSLADSRRGREHGESMQQARFTENERVRSLERALALEDERRKREQTLADRADENYQSDITAEFTTFVDPGDPTKTITARMQGGEWITPTGAPVPLGAMSGMMPLDTFSTLNPDYNKRRESAAGDLLMPQYGEDTYEYTTAPTEAERERELRTDPREFMGLVNAEKSYKDEFAPVIPGTAGLENLIASTAGLPSSEIMEEGSEFWREWKRLSELEQRHELFGSALTESEQREWRAATINPNMKPEMIRAHLKKRGEHARKMAEYQVALLAKQGRSPEALRAYGGIVDVPSVIARSRDGSYWAELDARQKADREALASKGQDSASVPSLPPLSESDVARLQELREKRARGEL